MKEYGILKRMKKKNQKRMNELAVDLDGMENI